jgi:hypothetical protein
VHVWDLRTGKQRGENTATNPDPSECVAFSFNYSILEGLRSGNADRNRDRKITVSELQEYVVRRVRELTGSRQQPVSRRENVELDFPVLERL